MTNVPQTLFRNKLSTAMNEGTILPTCKPIKVRSLTMTLERTRAVSNPRKRQRTENAQTTTPDEKRSSSSNTRVGDDESLIVGSTVPQERPQTPSFTSAIVEHVLPLQHAPYWGSKISSVFVDLMRGLLSLCRFLISNLVGDSWLPPERYTTDRSPADVDNEIMECIRKPHNSNEFGDVYVFKQEPRQRGWLDSKSKLLKIGCATMVYARRKQLQTQYRVDLIDVEGDRRKHVHMKHFERAERLAQIELLNFRYRYPWPGDKRPPVGYTEWFLIDTEIAVRVVQRWREFLSKDPYDKDGKLKDYWRQRLDKVAHPEIERHNDHESRHKRWKWFVDGDDKDEQVDRRTQNPSIDNKAFETPQTLANTTATWAGENDTTRTDGSVTTPNSAPLDQTSTGTEGTLDPCRNFAVRYWHVFCTVQCFLWLINALRIWRYFDRIVMFAWLVISWIAFQKKLP